jgi:outer membrane receptor for ferric coprogen and ferric-rhodotorulic acid
MKPVHRVVQAQARNTTPSWGAPFSPRLTAWAVYAAMAGTTVAGAIAPRAADAQPVERNYDIPGGPLSGALARFAAEAGILLSADARLTEGKSTAGLRGRYAVQEGLNTLLNGTGLAAIDGPTGYVLEMLPPADKESLLPEVSVTGSADRLSDMPPEQPGFKAEYQESATKMPLSIRETPQSITVTTRESIDARQARDLSSALEMTAGVTSGRSADGGPFAGRGLGGGAGYIMRGQELDTKRDVRIDGAVVSGNEFDLSAFERVEAVKGPSSVLYGQGSLGGFINMVRKKPKAERSASIMTQIGSFNTKRVEADVAGAFDSDQRLLGRMTLAYDDSDAFIDHVETRTMVFAPGIEARIGDRTRALLQFLYQDDKYLPSRGVPLRLEGNEAKMPNVDRSLFAGVPSQEKSSAQNNLFTVDIDHEISDRWLGKLLLQKSGQSRERFFDSYANNGYLDASGDVTMYSDTSITKDDNWAGELRLEGRFDALGREHAILVGFEQNQRKTHLAFGYTPLGPGNIYTGEFQAANVLPGGARNQDYDFDINTTSENRAAYGQVVLSLFERTKLLAGLRFDQSDIRRRNNLTGTIDEKRDEEPTWRLGLTQDFSNSITGYATYAQSFNPSVDARSESGTILDPETGEGVELGIKTEWFERRLGATVAVFRQELDNRPITDPNNNNFSINGGLMRTDGLEVELTGSPVPGLTLGAASAWLDSEFIDPQDENFGTIPGGTVKRQSSLFVSYEIQRGTFVGLGMGATLINVGDRALGGEEFVAGYERVDLNFYYRGLPKWDFSLQVRNLFDETYIERPRDRFQDNFFGSPRAALFRAEYRFF